MINIEWDNYFIYFFVSFLLSSPLLLLFLSSYPKSSTNRPVTLPNLRQISTRHSFLALVDRRPVRASGHARLLWGWHCLCRAAQLWLITCHLAHREKGRDEPLFHFRRVLRHTSSLVKTEFCCERTVVSRALDAHIGSNIVSVHGFAGL